MSAAAEHGDDRCPAVRPIARPIVTDLDGPVPHADSRYVSPSAHDIVAEPASATHTPKRLSGKQTRISLLVDSLAPLDWQVASDVGRFRLMSGSQLQRRFFNETPAGGRAARRLLLRLVNHDVLARLDRRIGGVRGGSAGYIYTLGLSGQKLLNQGKRARRHREPGWPFLNHTLAITELYVQLAEQAKVDGQLNLVTFDPEPLCWRSQAGLGPERLHLRPDAFVSLERGQHQQFWFVEVDLGTESQPVLRKKMTQYLVWLETEFEQQRLGGVFPRVLWHTTDPARQTVLDQLARKAPGPDGLHVTSGLLLPDETEEPP